MFQPPVPLPTAIGKFDEIHDKPVFGPSDPTPLGQSFHGIAREWGETPQHWQPYGCNPALTKNDSWMDKREHFGTVDAFDGSGPIQNWSGFKIKCFKLQIREHYAKIKPIGFDTRFYSYHGMVPGPTFKARLGEPMVVRFENHLEAEASVHLHGGHSPSHSDGFPTFYVLQGEARDYFYPHLLPQYVVERDANGKPTKYAVDVGESQSTMWYHDHAMDATAYNVSKGLAGFFLCFGEEELKLIRDRVLPGYGPHSCVDATCLRYDGGTVNLHDFADPDNPGFYLKSKEPYYNPFDIPFVLQDKVIDPQTDQISYDLTDHNGYIGDTFIVNGVAWPKLCVRNRKYRFRILDGSNARVFRLRIMKADDFDRARRFGIDALDRGNDAAAASANAGEPMSGEFKSQYDRVSKPFMRIGKDSWLWSFPVEMKSLLLAMANRADIVVDFCALAKDLKPGETQEFVLVNTMPQFDGRGPKPKLEDGGDPRVLPLPFDVPGKHQLVELNRPIGLMKFVVRYAPPGTEEGDPEGDTEASITPVRFEDGEPIPETGSALITTHRTIQDEEIVAVREFIFERGKGAWQINGRFYDPFIANAAPQLDGAEEWVLRNGGGGWWHPIHIHLESHQLVRYEKDFGADDGIDLTDPPARNDLRNAVEVQQHIGPVELRGLHDTQVLGPNTVARIRMRHRTWNGPFVFHCHNLEHEDMRMMFNFEPVPYPENESEKAANTAPSARTHGKDVTLDGKLGELPWHHAPVPKSPVTDAGEDQIPARKPKQTN
jgi:FtsP/CotA-like multicopper oxidase with cupredoxin domain